MTGSDTTDEAARGSAGEKDVEVDHGSSPSLVAGECPEGHLTCPPHPRCPTCGRLRSETVDLAERTAIVVTWTSSTAPPPGVRSPNHLAIVAFDVDGREVRAIGQLTTDDVVIGDEVRPVAVDELRDPSAGIREAASQSWSGFRFEPLRASD